MTGTVLFTPLQRNQIVQREQEVYDSFGRRRRAGAHVSGAERVQSRRPFHLHRRSERGHASFESFNEQILYNANQTTPALSSYFELMDRLIPSFLSTLSSQKIKGTRILLQ